MVALVMIQQKLERMYVAKRFVWILFLKQWVSLKEWLAALLSVGQGLSLSVCIHREIADNGWRWA